LYPDLTPIDVNAKRVPINKPLTMQFACKNEKDYISSLEDWGFLFKIDLELEAFSDAQTKCDSIDRKYE
jgi:hypothetical protein